MPDDATVRDALSRALTSAPLAGSPRLQSFLTYVVEESLAGRADRIAGKTIAQDVYGREPVAGQDNIVRVDARRLRRALAEYYAADGLDDPVRIQIDNGGYAPRFERSDAPPSVNGWSRAAVWTGAALCCAVALSIWSFVRDAGPDITPAANTDRGAQERLALASKSIATLQAANLVQQGSELLFPIADYPHQRAAEGLFRDAIRIDPTHADAYAGASHSLATQAILASDADQRASLLAEAATMAEQAVDLNPTSGWTVSANAWLAFGHRDIESALTLSERAASLADQDGRVLDYQAIIHLLTGDFERAAALSNPQQSRKVMGGHMAYRNIHRVALFHLGDNERAIDSFNRAIELGGPVSELTLVYKAAAFQASGQRRMARQMLDELVQTWPAFQPDRAISHFYVAPEAAAQVLDQLRAAGWQAPG